MLNLANEKRRPTRTRTIHLMILYTFCPHYSLHHKLLNRPHSPLLNAPLNHSLDIAVRPLVPIVCTIQVHRFARYSVVCSRVPHLSHYFASHATEKLVPFLPHLAKAKLRNRGGDSTSHPQDITDSCAELARPKGTHRACNLGLTTGRMQLTLLTAAHLRSRLAITIDDEDALLHASVEASIPLVVGNLIAHRKSFSSASWGRARPVLLKLGLMDENEMVSANLSITTAAAVPSLKGLRSQGWSATASAAGGSASLSRAAHPKEVAEFVALGGSVANLRRDADGRIPRGNVLRSSAPLIKASEDKRLAAYAEIASKNALRIAQGLKPLRSTEAGCSRSTLTACKGALTASGEQEDEAKRAHASAKLNEANQSRPAGSQLSPLKPGASIAQVRGKQAAATMSAEQKDEAKRAHASAKLNEANQSRPAGSQLSPLKPGASIAQVGAKLNAATKSIEHSASASALLEQEEAALLKELAPLCVIDDRSSTCFAMLSLARLHEAVAKHAQSEQASALASSMQNSAAQRLLRRPSASKAMGRLLQRHGGSPAVDAQTTQLKRQRDEEYAMLRDLAPECQMAGSSKHPALSQELLRKAIATRTACNDPVALRLSSLNPSYLLERLKKRRSRLSQQPAPTASAPSRAPSQRTKRQKQ